MRPHSRDSNAPWRGPSSTSRGAARGGFSSHRGGGTSRDAPISAAGLRRATGQVGRQLGEMEMLLSPSRGEGLTERATQERFRAHIDDKLAKLERDLPEGGDAALEARRRAELSTILLDLRKLREGLTASHRVDGFTLKVYTDSIRYSISASNLPQLSACLPHLVFDILPKLAGPTATPPPPAATTSLDPLAGSLAALSLSGQNRIAVDTETVVFYQSLYLLYLICHLADLAAYHSALLAFTSARPPSVSPPTTPELWDGPDAAEEDSVAHSMPLHPHFAYTQRVFAALAATNYAAFAKLVPPAGSPATSPSSALEPGSLDTIGPSTTTSLPEPYTPGELHLAVARLAIPRVREQAWPAMAKSYKVFTDYEWLARALLFPSGDVQGVRAFLRGKGVAVE